MTIQADRNDSLKSITELNDKGRFRLVKGFYNVSKMDKKNINNNFIRLIM